MASTSSTSASDSATTSSSSSTTATTSTSTATTTTDSDASSSAERCAQCAKSLTDRSKMAFGKLYHLDCFACTSCATKMVKYIVHDEKPYCLLCTHTMFEPQCAECGSWLLGRKSENKPPVYALGQLYHSRCFQCSTCEKRILGKFFISELEKIYCPEHPPEGTSEELKKACNTPMPPDTAQYILDDEVAVVTSTTDETN